MTETGLVTHFAEIKLHYELQKSGSMATGKSDLNRDP